MNEIKVKSLKQLNVLRNITEGEIIYVTDEEKYYQLDNGSWDPVDQPQMTVYDFNRMIMAQMPAMSEDSIEDAKKEINELITPRSKFFMLVSNEQRYYTVFNLWQEGNLNTLSDEVIACLKELGTIKSIHITEDNPAAECWVSNKEGTFVLYLFDYTAGVIDCR